LERRREWAFWSARIHAAAPSRVDMSKPASRPAIMSDFAIPKFRGSESARSTCFAAFASRTRRGVGARRRVGALGTSA
jgi:hypothetical protein